MPTASLRIKSRVSECKCAAGRIDDEDRALLGPDGGLVTAFRQFGAAGSDSLGPAELLATAAAVGDDSAESMVGALLDEVGNAGGRLELSQFAAMLHDAEGQLAQDSTPEPVTRRRDEPEPVQEVAEEEEPVEEGSVQEEPEPEPEPDFEPEPEPEPDLEPEPEPEPEAGAEPQAQGRNDEAHLVSFIDVLAQMSRMDDGGAWAKIWQGQEEDEDGDADGAERTGKPRVSSVFPVAFDWGSVDESASYRWARGQKGKAEKL